MRSVRDRLGALALLLAAVSPQVAHAISSTGFLENHGVYPEAVRYYAHSPAADVFLTDTGVVIDLIASTETLGRTLEVIDAQGRLVRTLRMTTATDAIWDLLDETRRPASAGAYFIRLRAGDSSTTVVPARVIVVR